MVVAWFFGADPGFSIFNIQIFFDVFNNNLLLSRESLGTRGTFTNITCSYNSQKGVAIMVNWFTSLELSGSWGDGMGRREQMRVVRRISRIHIIKTWVELRRVVHRRWSVWVMMRSSVHW